MVLLFWLRHLLVTLLTAIVFKVKEHMQNDLKSQMTFEDVVTASPSQNPHSLVQSYNVLRACLTESNVPNFLMLEHVEQSTLM